MTPSANPSETHEKSGFLAPRPEGQPVDHCFRCGVETAPGVGLCEQHNRGHVSGPSSTQMHATIFLGIVAGVVVFFLIAGLVVTTTGPYAGEVTAAGTAPDGGVAISYSVTNEGDDEGVADCRVTRDGVPRPDDFAFRTEVIAGGQTVTYERELAVPPAGSAGYDLEAMTVQCS